ncbi:MAG: arsinothricin resistance N-acetyltransferase ArsN1 family B [Fimbriimonadaceae bacterium]
MEIQIRPATPDDAGAIAAVYAHFVLTSPATFEIVPPDTAEIRNRIVHVTEMYPWLVAEGPEGVVGYAYAGRHRERHAYQWAVDSSAYIAPHCQRLGLGRSLYTRLFEILTRQGLTNVFAGITLPNEASVGLHVAMGFAHVGVYRNVGYKFGAWHDTSWWQLSLRHHDGEPAAPVSWRNL